MTSVAVLKSMFRRLPEHQLREIQEALDVELKRRESVSEQARRF